MPLSPDSATPFGNPKVARRQSIEPTFDSRSEPGAYHVETRIDGHRLSLTTTSDPFVCERVTLGWRDLLRGLLRRRLEVEVLVGGHWDRIEDVLELDDNYLGSQGSTRRIEWDAQLDRRLGDFAAVEGEHDDD